MWASLTTASSIRFLRCCRIFLPPVPATPFSLLTRRSPRALGFMETTNATSPSFASFARSGRRGKDMETRTDRERSRGRGGGGSGSSKDKIDALGRLLTRILRHMAAELNLNMRSDGYVKVQDLLNLNMKTFANIQLRSHTVDDVRAAEILQSPPQPSVPIMAYDETTNPSRTIDPRSGFCRHTKTFHSLRPRVPLPPLSQPLSLTQYALSLLRSESSAPAPTTTVLIDAASGRQVSYSHFLAQIESLASSLAASSSLSRGHVAFILAPSSLHVPVLYFALLALGVTISPANPLGSHSEIAYQVQLSNPVIAFATSATSHKLPTLPLGTILLDSPEFLSMLQGNRPNSDQVHRVEVSQSDSAAILYSSGTTGRVKGVLLTHRNLIALIEGFYQLQRESHKKQTQMGEQQLQPVSLFTLPLFHVFGFFMLVRAVAMGETLVLMERFDFEGMLRAVEKYRVNYMPVSPPLIVALTKSDLVKKYDLSSLLLLGSGGAPLGKETAERFTAKFPNIEITQGYGLTETGGGAARMIEIEESQRHGSVGRMAENMEAKIVDPVTGEALPPGHRGELWLRGPTIMKGYVGDDKATAETLDSEGWLKTGDLCYFDSDGFLFIVDRLKELIKYKAYQVPPAELEHLLLSHPEISDAAVIPYPDEEAGEIPMAFVVRKPGSNITEAQVINFIAKQVAPYKKIRRVSFINSIPKSPAGKILRRELVTHALSVGLARL